MDGTLRGEFGADDANEILRRWRELRRVEGPTPPPLPGGPPPPPPLPPFVVGTPGGGVAWTLPRRLLGERRGVLSAARVPPGEGEGSATGVDAIGVPGADEVIEVSLRWRCNARRVRRTEIALSLSSGIVIERGTLGRVPVSGRTGESSEICSFLGSSRGFFLWLSRGESLEVARVSVVATLTRLRGLTLELDDTTPPRSLRSVGRARFLELEGRRERDTAPRGDDADSDFTLSSSSSRDDVSSVFTTGAEVVGWVCGTTSDGTRTRFNRSLSYTRPFEHSKRAAANATKVQRPLGGLDFVLAVPSLFTDEEKLSGFNHVSFHKSHAAWKRRALRRVSQSGMLKGGGRGKSRSAY